VADDAVAEDDAAEDTRWAVLIAGSNGYYKYRHQVILLARNPSKTNHALAARLIVAARMVWFGSV
jgi:glycosylphosphatidylinositol transamidase (GPIT) subunit GPI8